MMKRHLEELEEVIDNKRLLIMKRLWSLGSEWYTECMLCEADGCELMSWCWDSGNEEDCEPKQMRNAGQLHSHHLHQTDMLWKETHEETQPHYAASVSSTCHSQWLKDEAMMSTSALQCSLVNQPMNKLSESSGSNEACWELQRKHYSCKVKPGCSEVMEIFCFLTFLIDAFISFCFCFCFFKYK